MNLEKLNKLIAELLGWNKLPEATVQCPDTMQIFGLSATKPKWWFVHQLPHYSSDLNTCAEFEQRLPDIEWCRYEGELYKICEKARNRGRRITATAPQRCLAFIRTVAPKREIQIYN